MDELKLHQCSPLPKKKKKKKCNVWIVSKVNKTQWQAGAAFSKRKFVKMLRVTKIKQPRWVSPALQRHLNKSCSEALRCEDGNRKGKEKAELVCCFPVTHHLPSRRTRVSLKNYWLPSSSSTCPSETLMLWLHSSPLEDKLPLRVEHPPRPTVQHKHRGQNCASALSLYLSAICSSGSARGGAESLPKTGGGMQDKCGGHPRSVKILLSEPAFALLQLEKSALSRHKCAVVFLCPSAKAETLSRLRVKGFVKFPLQTGSWRAFTK